MIENIKPKIKAIFFVLLLMAKEKYNTNIEKRNKNILTNILFVNAASATNEKLLPRTKKTDIIT
jgi:hypothetical protein